MNINTKFDLLQDVYFIDNNKVQTAKVRFINIEIRVEPIIVYYVELTEERSKNKFLESELFASKQSLLGSL